MLLLNTCDGRSRGRRGGKQTEEVERDAMIMTDLEAIWNILLHFPFRVVGAWTQGQRQS